MQQTLVYVYVSYLFVVLAHEVQCIDCKNKYGTFGPLTPIARLVLGLAWLLGKIWYGVFVFLIKSGDDLPADPKRMCGSDLFFFMKWNTKKISYMK